MFKTTIVFVLLFSAFSSQLAEESQIIAKLNQMEQSNFGKFVLHTLMIEMETSDSLDHLINTMQKLEDRYQTDQKEDDLRNKEFQASCDVDIAAYDKDIADSNYHKIVLEGKLEGDLYPNRAIHQGVEKAKLAEVKQLNSEIDELDKERTEQNEIYEEKMTEHREASRIIRQAQAIIKDGLVEPSLLELKKNKNASKKIAPNVLLEVSKDLQTSIAQIKKNHKYTKAYASLFKVLLTIMNKSEATADQGSVQRIIQLCSDLLDKIDQSADLERFAEDKRVQAFNKHKGLLNRDLNSANSILANTQATIESYNNQIQMIENSIQNIVERLENINDMRHERYIECEQDAFDYSQKRAERDQDRQLVSDVIGLVNTNMRVLKEQLALRVAAGENIQ